MTWLRSRRRCGVALVLALLALAACGADADETRRRPLILATTTSTQDTGLLDELVPLFEAEHPYRVKTLAVGTGEALAMGARGDADVLLVHAPALEKEAVSSGAALRRRVLMHNEFLIVGPASDPAGIAGLGDAVRAFRRIAATGAPFVSRGDRSGTHVRELALRERAGVPAGGPGYLESGQGMGATLVLASEKRAYTLCDRSTFLAFRERLELVPQVEGDPPLRNVYSMLEVNPERFAHVNHAGALAFGDFLLGETGSERIARFGVDRFGEPLFFPGDGEATER